MFLSLTKAGRSAIFNTSGNLDTHVILRGGRRPNYDTESVHEAEAKWFARTAAEPDDRFQPCQQPQAAREAGRGGR